MTFKDFLRCVCIRHLLILAKCSQMYNQEEEKAGGKAAK